MKDGFIKVAAASPRVCVADPKVNADRILDMMKKAARDHVKILAFPELSLTGYTCGDLFGQRTLLTASEKELVRLA
ncbi:MAG TPA: NAD(+) synthase, partial [Lachnospiraceae bacterium]|nr:NAD(+) synthase [Lachnospiraceae bacterium]